MDTKEKIYVAGHRGLVGSAILKKLIAEGFANVITRTHAELDLTDQKAVESFFEKEKPDCVFLAAAKVGGIYANQAQGGAFIYENLMIQTHVIHAAWKYGAQKLLFLGSSCIYPKLAPQPLKEAYLLSGLLEPTNEPYAIAKIAGIKMCEAYNRQYGTNFLAVMPTNLYGPNDNFDIQASHVLPALIRKIHDAKVAGKNEVSIWGTGCAKREFLFSEDMAEACILLMRKCTAEEIGGIVNIGCGKDITIDELAHLIAEIVGYKGMFVYDKTKPDGTPQKLLDISRSASFGWAPKTSLHDGIRLTYEWYRSHQKP